MLTTIHCPSMPKIKVRFHLSKGEHYMHWQVRIGEQVMFLHPDDVCITMNGARLVNQLSTARKIHAGDNKTVCAWVTCDSIDIRKKDSSHTIIGEHISFNPRRTPHWVNDSGDILDGTTHRQIQSNSNQLYKTA